MKTYSVIEDRGDGIEYERFFGSFEECAILSPTKWFIHIVTLYTKPPNQKTVEFINII